MSLLFPARCALCGKLLREDRLICSECLAKEVPIRGKLCTLCGVETKYCTCKQHKHHYRRRIAVAYYTKSVRRMVGRFKFYRRASLSRPFGELMAANIRSKYARVRFDAIVSVPMHPYALWRRGYNCAELLADKVSEILGIPKLQGVLIKVRLGKSQKEVKGFSARRANVFDAFRIQNKERLYGKTILLIDDVCTSGATLDECAKMLRLYGAKAVYAATFAARVLGKE